MKRVLSLFLCLSLIVSFGVMVSAADFGDLSSDHWAYQNIMKLVDEGTINGYEDGTFKPGKSVTRAEFVKMLGKWNQSYSGTYSDISSSHWAYEYIMWSGLEPIGNSIYPDVEIKRSDVINLIWKRNGSPSHSSAPFAISSQGTNSDATSWAYTIGLMKGDDGLNLRLDSSLTRAEAATLIIRSREAVTANKTYNFIDVVSEDVLKLTYESLAVLDGTYNGSKSLTYGEVARMALDFSVDGGPLNFVGNDLLVDNKQAAELFEHKYSNEMFILSKYVWGYDYYTKEKIDTQATVQDTVSAILYGYARKGTLPTDFGAKDGYFSDCTDVNSTVYENMYLSYAKKIGLKLKAGNLLGAQEGITVKKYAAIMAQLNEVVGVGICYNNGKKVNAKINANMSVIPANYADFKYTVAGAPSAICSLKNDGVLAKNDYYQMNRCAFIFNGFLNEIVNLAKKNSGCNLDVVYYPSLSYNQGKKVIFVAKFTLRDYTGNMSEVSIDKLLAKVTKTPTGRTVNSSGEFYVAFETYEPLMDITLPYSKAYVKAVY